MPSHAWYDSMDNVELLWEVHVRSPCRQGGKGYFSFHACEYKRTRLCTRAFQNIWAYGGAEGEELLVQCSAFEVYAPAWQPPLLLHCCTLSAAQPGLGRSENLILSNSDLCIRTTK